MLPKLFLNKVISCHLSAIILFEHVFEDRIAQNQSNSLYITIYPLSY